MAKRDIMFRAWDGQRFYYFGNHAYTLSYNDISGWNVHPNTLDYRGAWTTGESSQSAEAFVLQQSTELEDNKKQCIYEGDIVKYGYFALNDHNLSKEQRRAFDEAEITTTIKIVEVKWDFHELSDLQTLIWGNPDVIGVEIIGNIFENPDLLKDKEQ